MRWMAFRFWFYLVLASLLAAIPVALISLSLLFDWNSQRQPIAAHVADLVGAETIISGDISVRLLPVPLVRIEGITIILDDPAASRDRTPIRLSLSAIDLRFETLPLLSGRFVVHDMIIHGARLRLTEIAPAALLPYSGISQQPQTLLATPAPSTSPSDPSEGAAMASFPDRLRHHISQAFNDRRIAVVNGRLVDATLSWRQENIAIDIDQIDARFSINAESRNVEISGGGTWNNTPYLFRIKRFQHPLRQHLFAITAALRNSAGTTLAELRFMHPEFEDSTDLNAEATAKILQNHPNAIHGTLQAAPHEILAIASHQEDRPAAPFPTTYLEAQFAWIPGQSILLPHINMLSKAYRLEGEASLDLTSDPKAPSTLDAAFTLAAADFVAASGTDPNLSCYENLNTPLMAMLVHPPQAAVDRLVAFLDHITATISLRADGLPVGDVLLTNFAADLILDREQVVLRQMRLLMPWESTLHINDFIVPLNPSARVASPARSGGSFRFHAGQIGALLSTLCPEFTNWKAPFNNNSLTATGQLRINSNDQEPLQITDLHIKTAALTANGSLNYHPATPSVRSTLDIDLRLDPIDLAAAAPHPRQWLFSLPPSLADLNHPEIRFTAQIERVNYDPLIAHDLALSGHIDQQRLVQGQLTINDLAGIRITTDFHSTADDQSFSLSTSATTNDPVRFTSLLTQFDSFEIPSLLKDLMPTRHASAKIDWRGPLDTASAATTTKITGELILDDISSTIEADVKGNISLYPAVPVSIRADINLADRDRLFGTSTAMPIPLSFEVALDGPADHPLQLTVDATMPDLSMRFDGALSRLSTNATFDGTLTTISPGLAAFPSTPIPPWLGDGPLQATAILHGKRDQFNLAGLNGHIGDNPFTIDAKLSLPNDSGTLKPRLAMQLAADRLALQPILGKVFNLKDQSSLFCPLPPDTELNWRPWSNYDLNVDFSIAQQTHGQFQLDDGKATFTIKTENLAGGDLQAEARLHGGIRIPEIELAFSFDSIDPQALFNPTTASFPMAGNLSGRGSLTAAGANFAAMIASLQGGGNLTIDDAALLGVDLHGFANSIKASSNTESVSKINHNHLLSGRTPLDSILMGFSVEGGIVQSRGGRINDKKIDGNIALVVDLPLCSATLDTRLRLGDPDWPTIRAIYRSDPQASQERTTTPGRNNWQFDVWSLDFAHTMKLLEAATAPEAAYKFSQTLLDLLRQRLEDTAADDNLAPPKAIFPSLDLR